MARARSPDSIARSTFSYFRKLRDSRLDFVRRTRLAPGCFHRSSCREPFWMAGRLVLHAIERREGAAWRRKSRGKIITRVSPIHRPCGPTTGWTLSRMSLDIDGFLSSHQVEFSRPFPLPPANWRCKILCAELTHGINESLEIDLKR